MKIIKQGNLNKNNLDVRKFECEKCGCIFEANHVEYIKDTRNDKYFCVCPICGTSTYEQAVKENDE